MQLINRNNQRLSCVDCLARNLFDALPPAAWVAGTQTLHLPGVALLLQRPRHPLYAFAVHLVPRRLAGLQRILTTADEMAELNGHPRLICRVTFDSYQRQVVVEKTVTVL